MAQGFTAETLAFLRDNWRWLLGGLILTFASSFGQTFFIALFAESLRLELGLSHGGWGTIYAVGTLGSAAAFMALGKLADELAPARLAALVITFLALVAVLMANVTSALVLTLAICGLRLGGQAMMTHVAVTITARQFVATRGRALAVVTLGHPLGEAVLPGLAVAAVAVLGWRSAWWAAAALLVLLLMPAAVLLLRRRRVPRGTVAPPAPPPALGLGGRHWRRPEVLRHSLFWLTLPGFMVSPAFGTALLFQGAHVVAVKGWSLEAYALGFTGYAAMSVLGSITGGVLVDRFGAVRLLPFFLVPLAGSLAIAGTAQAELAAALYLGVLGFGTGVGFTVVNAIWAELYGTLHLGAIRAVASGIGVFATALGPGATGLMLDAGIGIERQLVALAAATLVVCVGFAPLTRHIRRQQGPLGPGTDSA